MTQSKRHRHCRLIVLLLISVLSWQSISADESDTDARAKVKQFNLLAGPMGDALVDFALQSSTSVFIETNQVSGFRSRTLRGQFSIEEALQKLLLNSPFSYRYDNDMRAFIILEKEPEPLPEPAIPRNTTNPTDITEETFVTGIRASIIDAMNRKLQASEILEAITSEDIGKFPDSNLAESLQRVSGVTISYTNNEGNTLSVRGLNSEFNLVTLNGRQMPIASFKDASAAGTRSFDFADIASENIAAVEIYKTNAANRASGGIGAVVDIQTSRPFDFDRGNATFGAKAVHDSSNVNGDDITPEVFGLVSQSFFDKHFGLLVSGSYQQRDSQAETAEMQWRRNLYYHFGGTAPEGELQSPPLNNWYPLTHVKAITDYQRTRTNANAVIQFSPAPYFTASFDYTYSKMDIRSDGLEIISAFDGMLLDAYPTFDNNNTTITTTETDGGLRFRRTEELSINDNHSKGINFELALGDSFTLTLDAHASNATLTPKGDGNRRSVFYDVTNIYAQSFISNHEIPTVSHVFSDPTSGNLRDDLFISDFIHDVEGSSSWDKANAETSQIQLHGSWEVSEKFWLRTLNFGVSNTLAKNHVAKGTTHFYNPYQGAGDDSLYDPGIFSQANTRDILQQFSGGGDDVYYDFELQDAIDANAGRFPRLDPEYVDIGPYKSPYWDDFTGPQLNPEEDNSIEEETLSAYFQLVVVAEPLGMPFELVAGARYEDNDIINHSYYLPPVGIGWKWGEVFFTQFAAEKQHVTEVASYNDVLPSLNMRLNLSDAIIARIAYSESITRAEMNLMGAAKRITRPPHPGLKTAFEGVVGLLPYTSDNYDASLEWYYSDTSYVSFSYFEKHIDNFPVNVIIEKPLLGITDPYLGPRANAARDALARDGIDASDQNIFTYFMENLNIDWATGIFGDESDPVVEWDVTRAENAQSAYLDGWEFAFQHLFETSGFGYLFNYTHVNSSVDIGGSGLSSFSSSLPAGGDFMNVVGFYDKDGLEMRLAYHWNGEHSLLEEHSILQGVDSEKPVEVITEAYGQLDAQISYAFTNGVTTFIEGINITDERQRSYLGEENRLVTAGQFGARFSLGLRYVF